MQGPLEGRTPPPLPTTDRDLGRSPTMLLPNPDEILRIVSELGLLGNLPEATSFYETLARRVGGKVNTPETLMDRWLMLLGFNQPEGPEYRDAVDSAWPVFVVALGADKAFLEGAAEWRGKILPIMEERARRLRTTDAS